MMSLVVRYLPDHKMTSLSTSAAFQQTALASEKWPRWPHELVLSIRGDEADASLQVKLAEAHALVERAVVDGDGLLPTARTDADTRGGVDVTASIMILIPPNKLQLRLLL